MSDKTIFTKTYSVNSINVNPNKKLGLYGILGILQDAASLHAEELGFGYEQMVKDQTFWVLVRQKLKMNAWPHWNDTIEIKTWARELRGMNAFRDFEIYWNNEKIGECSTSWMILDGKTRKPTAPNFSEERVSARKDYQLDFEASKVILPEQMEETKTLEVRNSDLDMNNHVNNTKYSQWILDAIPLEYHKNSKLKEFEINFTAEAYLGDIIQILSKQKACPGSDCEVFFQGKRDSDGKRIFTASLLAQTI